MTEKRALRRLALSILPCAVTAFGAAQQGATADLFVAVSASPNPVPAGGQITYTILAGNAGPDAAAAFLTFQLSPGVSIVSCAATGGASCDEGATGVNVQLAWLTPGAASTETITVVAAVDVATAAGSVLSGSAAISLSAMNPGPVTDPQPGNDSAYATVATVAPVPAVSVSPSQLDFGLASIGSGSSWQTIQVTSTGSGPLRIHEVGVNGDFSLEDAEACVRSLTVGATCAIGVAFVPRELGPRQGLVTIRSDDPAGDAVVPLAGTGSAIQVSPRSVRFPLQPVGTTATAEVFVVNGGGRPVAVHGVELSGSGDLAQTNDCGASLAAHSSCTIVVTYTPAVAGSSQATLVVTNEDPRSPQMATVEASATALVLSPASGLSFDEQVRGVPVSRIVTLSNAGEVPLVIERIRATGRAFSQRHDCGRRLAARAACEIHVTFEPKRLGAHSGELIVRTQDPTSPARVALAGVGTGIGSLKKLRVYYDYMELPDQGTSCTPSPDSLPPVLPTSPDCAFGQHCLDHVCRGHSHAPDPAVLQEVVDAFAARGVELRLERAPQPIPEIHALFLGPVDPRCQHRFGGDLFNAASLADVKAAYSPHWLKKDVHYAVFGHHTVFTSAGFNPDPCALASGIAELNGYDFTVTSGRLYESGVRAIQRFSAGTFMHELGHNLGLHHGGAHDGSNYKPNYLSVMSYYYQASGIPASDAIGSSRIDPGLFRFDYSDQLLPSGGPTPGELDERGKLSEPAGLGSGTARVFAFMDGNCAFQLAASEGPVDWDGDGLTSNTNASVDLNPNDWDVTEPCVTPRLTSLRGFDDWAYLFTGHGRQPPAPASVIAAGQVVAEPSIEELLERHLVHAPRRVDLAIPGCGAPIPASGFAGPGTIAVLGADDLDVNEIDPASLRFHRTTPAVVRVRDLDGDGRPDLLLGLDGKMTRLHRQAKRARLSGWLWSGQRIFGEGAVSFVSHGTPCRN